MARTNTNTVVITGTLVRNPEEIANGAGAQFALAVNEAFKPKDSEEWQEYASFIDVKQWGPRAKAVLNFIEKGAMVCVTGKLKQERWEKDGQKQSKVVVVAVSTEFMPKGTGAAGAGGSKGSSGASDAADFDGDDDIPF
jgi:single-strand DNA-binding protein